MIALALLCLLAIDPVYLSIQKKLGLIQDMKYRPGTRAFLWANELNAYAREVAIETAPKAIHDVRFTLDYGKATAMAKVDFLELNKAHGGKSNWLMDHLFSGEKPVKVMAHIQTQNGQARVDVDRVEMAGVALDGAALQFVIQRYVLPEYPDAKIARWFPMSYRIDHLEVKPTGVAVFIKK